MIGQRGNLFSGHGFVCPTNVKEPELVECAQKLEVTVAGDEGSARLDRVLAARLQELSRSRLKALILAGSVTVGTPRSATPLIMSRRAT